MKYIVTLNDKQYEVEVEKGKAVAAYIGEAPAPAPVAAAPAPAAPAPAAAPAAPAGAGDPITAPMPGTILDVRCQQGQTVKNGDILFILEAMKMENEIFASKDGTVTSVCVSKGASVDTGSVLCTIS
ncbi:biotin/lipoyl-containing protein [Butyricicoccus porcorum]|uniref:Acetyl-CoA carboxylase biotin carboxyl carrier protein subunit n=1 Tax=Butyricicoccus porcorum TaxID=1945634 RepID=A0A252F2W5_9FIRM|nr:biotin/lipoyl-containing protein [Butyricicoccus porcorum]OUM20116.1 acetyl-CoA carboxylase biotin carboxyl carrier protein subunit [Butyricicoccus porcorum]